MTASSPSPLTSRDFEQFAIWYSSRQKRRSGYNASPRTIDTRVAHVLAISRLMGCLDPHDTGTLVQDRERVEQMVEALTARLSSGSVRSYLYSMLAYAEWAKANGLIQYIALTTADIPSPNPRKHLTVYERSEVEVLISAARGRELRWWMFITVMADTGRRVGEILSVEWDWIHLDTQPAFIELPTTKSRKPNYVPLTKRIVEQVFTDDNIDKLLQEKRNGRRQFARDPQRYPFPWTYSSVMKRFQHMCDTTGLPYRGLHNLRHSLITDRIARGIPLQAVSSLAGHSSVSVTQRAYDHCTALSFAQYIEPDAGY